MLGATSKALEQGEKANMQGSSIEPNKEEEIHNIPSLPLLKVRQPWASLIMCGIKSVEGRKYPSKHKDTRIRIVASKYKPSKREIERAVDFYHHYLNVPRERFPHEYPTDRLLGTVKLIDSVSQEQWRKSIAKEEERNWLMEMGVSIDGESEGGTLSIPDLEEPLTIPDYVRLKIEKRCYIDDPYVWILEHPICLE